MRLVSSLLLLVTLVTIIGVASAGEEGAINAALQANAGGSYTLPSGVHEVSGQIIVPENTEFKGEYSENGELKSKIVLGEKFCLPLQEPIIRLNSGCTVAYIDFDGNSENRDGVPYWKGHSGTGSKKKWGQGYDNFIGCKNVKNVRVHHCNFFNNLGDSFRIFTSKNIEFDHNTASKGGHDVFFAVRSEGVSVHDNLIYPRINSAIRLMDVNNAWIFNNIIKYQSKYNNVPYDAGPDIQIQHDSGQMQNIIVCYNTFINSCGPGLWLVGKNSGNENLDFHHNVFYNAGSNDDIIWIGGVIASGYDNAYFTNNVFDGSYLGGVNFYATNSGWATAGTAYIDKCILIDAIPAGYNDLGGYGIYNSIKAQKVVCSNTNFYNNHAGDKSGTVTITGKVTTDPRKSPNPSDFTWNEAKEMWECQGLNIADLNIYSIPDGAGVYDGLPELTQEDIDEFEFINIFSILDVKYDSNLNLSSEMPRNYKSASTCNVTVLNNTYMPQTRYEVRTDNYTTKVEYKYNNTTSVHYLWTRYSASGLSGYDNMDMWELNGGASRNGDLFVIPEAACTDATPVEIVVYNAAGKQSAVTNYNKTIYNEDLTNAIHPIAYLLAAVIFIFLCGIIHNLKTTVRKWKFTK